MFSLAIALAGGVGLTALQGARRRVRAEQTHPPEGRFLSVAGARVHAVELGQPAGTAPDLVLIHGSNGSTRDMSFRLAPALADRYRVLMFDRPGLGYSDPLHGKGASLREQADVLRQAAAQMGALHPIVLGQSYGGAVALAWAVYHPKHISALVSVSGASHPWDGFLDPFYRLTSAPVAGAVATHLIGAFTPQKTVTRALEDVFAPQPVPKGYAEYLGIELTLRAGSLRANARQRANLLGDIKKQAPHYGKIAIPVELLHGEADTTVGASIHALPLLRDVPEASLTMLKGIGHMPHQVATDEVIAAVHRAASRAAMK